MSHKERSNTRRTKMFELISQQVQSGLTQEQFCKNHQISIATFGYWRKKYIQSKQPSSPNEFVPIRIKNTIPSKHSIEIELPNQIVLRCQDWQTEQLPLLIKRLQDIEITSE